MYVSFSGGLFREHFRGTFFRVNYGGHYRGQFERSFEEVIFGGHFGGSLLVVILRGCFEGSSW